MRDRNRRVDAFFVCVSAFSMALSQVCFFDKTFPIAVWLLRRRKMPPLPHRVCVIRLFSLRWIFRCCCSSAGGRARLPLSILVHDVNHSQLAVCVCTPISYWSLFLYIARATQKWWWRAAAADDIRAFCSPPKGVVGPFPWEPLILYVITQTPPAEPTRGRRE